MAKRTRIAPDVELIPYYEYDPSIHNIEYRYLPQGADGTYTNWIYDYNTDYETLPEEASDWGDDTRQYPYGPGYYGRPRRRRRRRRRPYGYGYGPGPGFVPVPLPLPLPVPAPYPPFYGPYPFL